MNPVYKQLAMQGHTFNLSVSAPIPPAHPLVCVLQGDVGLPGLPGNPGPPGRKVHLGFDALLCLLGFLAGGVIRQESYELPAPQSSSP